MPIKLKCSCGQVLSVPEKMAGKTGNCPKCKKKIKIPIPKAKAGKPVSAGSRTATAAAGPGAAEARDGLESLFEDAGLKEQKGPTCPNCKAAIRPGTVFCTECGYNFESGESLASFRARAEDKPEFDNLYLQEAASNMKRELITEDRRSKSEMPWFVLMSFLIGAVTLCLAGVIIVDGKFGEPAEASTFIGKIQRWPVFTTLGLTALITGCAISIFAHLNIVAFAFSRSVAQGFACFILPLVYSIIYGIMHWTENKAPVKAIMMAICFIGLGVFLIFQGGGFQLVLDAFR